MKVELNIVVFKLCLTFNLHLKGGEFMFKPSLNLSVFNALDTEGQVEEVNKALASGISLNQFGKDIGLDEGAIRKRFKRAGYVRSKEGKKLFELTGDIPPANKPKATKKVNKSIEETKVIGEDKQEIINRSVSMGWADIESFMERLVNVEAELKAVKDELKTIKDKTINENSEAIQVYSEGGILQIKEFTTDLKQISYRYNLEVLYKLNKLCELYPHVSKTKIINTLLDESIDKYLK